MFAKYGADGTSTQAEYTTIDSDGVDQKTLFVSYFAPVQLKAFFLDGTDEVLYSNKSANSLFGMCPLRFLKDTMVQL